MKRTLSIATFVCIALSMTATLHSCACNNEEEQKNTVEMENKIIEEPEFDIITNMGTMRIKLYSKTPKHRDKFVKLVAEHY